MVLESEGRVSATLDAQILGCVLRSDSDIRLRSDIRLCKMIRFLIVIDALVLAILDVALSATVEIIILRNSNLFFYFDGL